MATGRTAGRNVLAGLSPCPGWSPNAGLWLDRYIGAQGRDDTNSRRDLAAQVSAIPEPGKPYAEYFVRWKRSLETLGAECRVAKAVGRIVVGLGGESVSETAITLHRTYGVPLIPGSALKGLAASFARQRLDGDWGSGSSAYKALFGEMGSAGYVSFFDALYVPASGHLGRPLYPDVITVHHPDYYQSGKATPPADWDSPTPIPFLSATGDYLMALSGPNHFVSRAFDILKLALAEVGVGAKTSSGYGRMTLAGPPPPMIDPARRKADELVAKINSLPNGRVANEIGQRVTEWRALDGSDEVRRRVAEAIVGKVREAGREKISASKGWYQELLDFLK
jgi:CRISPR-associated protein Cmr6